MAPPHIFVDQMIITPSSTDWVQIFFSDFALPAVIAFALYWFSKRAIFGQLLKDKAASERYEMKRLILKISANARIIALILHQTKNTVDHIKQIGGDLHDAGIFEGDTRVATLNQELIELDILLEIEISHCFGNDPIVKGLYVDHRRQIELFIALIMKPVKQQTDLIEWIEDVDDAARNLYRTEVPLLEKILH